MPYLGRSSNFGVRSVFHYLPSAGDTSVSGADADGKTLSFADGNYIDVYLNGVKLKHDTDYNTDTANTVAGLTATASSDEVTVVVYDAFSLATGFETLGGTFGGAVTISDTTASSSATTGALIVSGGAGVAADLSVGDDLRLISDNAVLSFGADSEVTLTHNPDNGLLLKHVGSGDGKKPSLTFQAGDNDIAADDVLGSIFFQAPDEGTGTDAILVAAGIEAVSEGDFSSSSNATKLSFKTGSSETATEKMSISSAGDMTLSGTLISSTSGDDNVVIGQNAGSSIASGGDDNVLIGRDAGDAITTGDQNVAVGFEALSTEDAHGENVAVGYRALKTLNAGAAGYNTAVGHSAGLSITTGVQNTFIGSVSGDAITEGGDNVGIGRTSLTSDTLGSRSIAIGTGTLQNQNFTTATNGQNIAIGYLAGSSVTTGTNNTIIGGALTGDALTTGSNNVAIGHNALSTEDATSGLVAIGESALENANGTDSQSVAVGFEALHNMTTGGGNTAVGYQAGEALSTAVGCTFIGQLAGTDATGNDNTAVGTQALFTETSGADNVAIGHDALRTQNGASSNTAVGSHAGDSITTGGNNTMVGHNSGHQISTGVQNVTVGNQSGDGLTTGNANILIGHEAGSGSNDISGESPVSTGTANVIIGKACQAAASDTNFSIVMGFECFGTASENFTFGKGTTDSNIAMGGTSITTPSDARYKENIEDATAGLGFINDLRPVTYKWRMEKDVPPDSRDYNPESTTRVMSAGEELRHGFIAQEIKTVLDNHSEVKYSHELWNKDESHDERQRVGPAFLIPMLVKSVQELSHKNDILTQRVDTLEGVTLDEILLDATDGSGADAGSKILLG